MSRRRWKPDSSVAVIESHVERAVAQVVEHRGHAAAGDERGALSDDPHLGDLTVDCRRCRDVGGERPLAEHGAQTRRASR